MKLWAVTCWLVFGAATLWVKPAPVKEWTVVVSGDTKGYLSPCGCTDPMSGGIRRRASATADLRTTAQTLVLDNGGLIAGQIRQDELKAETLAESLKSMKVDAINLSPEDARLGKGELMSLQRLSEGRFICSHLAPKNELDLKPFMVKGPFLVGGVTSRPELIETAFGVKTVNLETAVNRLMIESKKKKLTTILLFQGSEKEARSLAQKHRDLSLIVYSGAGDPPGSTIMESNTALVSPGEFGKYLISLKMKAKAITAYQAINLSPEFKDDVTVARLYKIYLSRVTEEKLLDQLPRHDTVAYAGSETCKKCHERSYNVWEKTAHATALTSLEKDNHDRDPDCVACHVTGLESKQGFQSRHDTPSLAVVGCESCHGPQGDHAKDPHHVKPDRSRRVKCMNCHDTGHSPNFNRASYWQKVAHH